MFDIGWGELVLIGIVALIAIGPKELPGVLRTLGQWMGKIRRMAAEFQGQFQEALREAEMSDLKKEVDQLGDAAQGLAQYDPLREEHYDGLGPPQYDKPAAAATAKPSAPSTGAAVDQNLPAERPSTELVAPEPELAPNNSGARARP
ncbi:MAG TPA: Sec-independent protein translocase protein TatB [Xanthobacteraceae bacterium]|nr:Sec-independent protein translocase protein TatB [Xanthobacteraceae bacterium]